MEAEPQLAKKYFLDRATVSEATFNEQMANIEASRRAIMELFGEHVIDAFREDDRVFRMRRSLPRCLNKTVPISIEAATDCPVVCSPDSAHIDARPGCNPATRLFRAT
jgi:hypothetical protein